MPRGEEVVRAETHTQKVWPTITENGDVKPLCAYHSDVETKNNTYANHLAGEVGMEGNDVGKTQEEPQEGRCAHCDLAIKNPGKHLDLILRPWQRGDRTTESGPTVPPSPTGIPRLDRARQRKRDNWAPKTKPMEPVIHSLNSREGAAESGQCLVAHDGPCPSWIHERTAARHEAMPARSGNRPPGFYSTIKQVADKPKDEEEEGVPHVLTGYTVDPKTGEHKHVGQIAFGKSDDGRALNVFSLHTRPQAARTGAASAMMDDLYQKHPDAWINHGRRTDDGVKWWKGYREPEGHEHQNVHNQHPSSGWNRYWEPEYVAGDMLHNHRNETREHWDKDYIPDFHEDPDMPWATHQPAPWRDEPNLHSQEEPSEKWRHSDDPDPARTAAMIRSLGGKYPWPHVEGPNGEPDEFPGSGLRQVRHSADMPTPLYHGTSRKFEPGEHIEPGHPSNFVRRMKHVYATEDPARAQQYGWHGLPQGWKDEPERTRWPRVYEVRPTGPYGHRSDAKGPDWASEDPFEVVREVWRHEPKESQRKMAMDDEHGDSYTDWDKHYPTFHEVHRGMAVHLPPDLHERAHNRDPDDEDDDDDNVAHDIIKHLSQQPLGQHWTADREVARRFANDSTWMAHNPEHGTPVTHVVLTAHKPAREHIETDQHKLDAMDEAEGVQPFDTGEGSEREVPLKSGTPLHIKGIEWAHQGVHMHPRGGEHDSDVENNIEPYTGPLHVHAGLRTVAHDSGDNQRIFHCFAGETRYITRNGVKTFAETVGTEQQVLTSDGDPRDGRWVTAKIHEYGEQPLWAVQLRRNKQTKTVYATAEHRWLVRGWKSFASTVDLRPGHRLEYVIQSGAGDLQPSHDGIRAGLIFGDGTVANKRWATIRLWGEKDKQLITYFEELPQARISPVKTDNGVPGVRICANLSATLKALPDSDDPAYLYGWLAGYFAADGNVTKQGQVMLSSARYADLEAVRDIAQRLGIATYGITSKLRQGYGDERRLLHSIEFIGSTLNEAFFLIEEHRDRFRFRSYAYERLRWVVESVEPTDRVETVYCARVPGTETFALEDHIHTGNCPFCGSGRVIAGSDGTTDCGFCNQSFTVQVQPRFPSFPQTVNGQPVQIPGMPGQPDMAPPGTFGPGANPPDDPDASGGFPGGDEDDDLASPDDEPEDDGDSDDSGDDKPAFLKNTSLYRTAAGDALTEQQYLRHLALAVAHDRPAALRRVRAQYK